jgi:hypothetical protein
MIPDKIKELRALQAQAQALEESIETERAKELAQLPERYGYDSVPAFIGALRRYARGVARGPRRVGRAAAPVASARVAGRGRKRRTRRKITDETKSQVKKLVQEGRTGAEIAKAVGISLPSVQNVKKELGLVKSRS